MIAKASPPPVPGPLDPRRVASLLDDIDLSEPDQPGDPAPRPGLPLTGLISRLVSPRRRSARRQRRAPSANHDANDPARSTPAAPQSPDPQQQPGR